ncbi:hypothetical protein [Umezawaea sp. Da 62-37]|uniref:hypothetical protein n=1 Tax=Umezawaea sp. Da 62-37 TaxID=3075927 RepID=UPI0028F6F08B|nr:hypothetical protein [Umezawaea sp. Da 62-37]WNV90318.1 hypothetical protein RM788_19165 [Umezawaea sp. Da 62-37]
MANTPKALHRGSLGNVTNTVVGTVPADKRWVLTNLVLTNYGTTGVNTYVQLDEVPLVHMLVLSPGATFTLDCTQVLGAGKSIHAWASTASAVAMHASGVEMDL